MLGEATSRRGKRTDIVRQRVGQALAAICVRTTFLQHRKPGVSYKTGR